MYICTGDSDERNDDKANDDKANGEPQAHDERQEQTSAREDEHTSVCRRSSEVVQQPSRPSNAGSSAGTSHQHLRAGSAGLPPVYPRIHGDAEATAADADDSGRLAVESVPTVGGSIRCQVGHSTLVLGGDVGSGVYDPEDARRECREGSEADTDARWQALREVSGCSAAGGDSASANVHGSPSQTMGECSATETGGCGSLLLPTRAAPGRCITVRTPQLQDNSGLLVCDILPRESDQQNRPIHIACEARRPALKEVMTRAMTSMTEDVFIAQGEDLQTQRAQISCVMKNTAEELDVRALRRGGLQLMALNGIPASIILTFSRHADLPMLYRYLQHGAVLMDQASRTADAIGTSSQTWIQGSAESRICTAGPTESQREHPSTADFRYM